MIVYRCDFHDQDEGYLVSWHTNRVDAETRLRQQTKVELVKWLNLNTDNG